MVLVLVVLFLVGLPLLELYVFVQVGEWIGYGSAILALIAISVLGILLVRREGLGAWRRAQAQLRAGEVPAAELVDGALITTAALLLIIPGFVTDAVGLLLLLPPLRYFPRRWARRHRVVRTGNAVYGRVIDVRGTAAPTQGTPPPALPPPDDPAT